MEKSWQSKETFWHPKFQHKLRFITLTRISVSSPNNTPSLSLSLPLSCVKYNGKNCLKIWFKQTYMSCFELEGLKHKNPFEAVRRGPREKGQICNTSTKGLRRTRLCRMRERERERAIEWKREWNGREKRGDKIKSKRRPWRGWERMEEKKRLGNRWRGCGSREELLQSLLRWCNSIYGGRERASRVWWKKLRLLNSINLQPFHCLKKLRKFWEIIHSYGVYGTRKNGPNHCFAFYKWISFLLRGSNFNSYNNIYYNIHENFNS